MTYKTNTLLAAMFASGISAIAPHAAHASRPTYYRVSPANIILNTTGTTPVLSATIPAGRWTVSIRATAVTQGGFDVVRCAIMIGSNNVNQAATNIGNYTPYVATESANVAIDTTSLGSQVVSLVCWHDYALPGEDIDGGATLLITPITGPLQ